MRSSKSLLEKGIIVSCQPFDNNESFYDYEFIVRMAKAAEFGGAVAVRIEGKENSRNLVKEISIPVISLIKVGLPIENFDKRCITPTVEYVLELYEAGAKIVAIDFTLRESKNTSYYSSLMNDLRHLNDLEIIADVSTIEEGLMAFKCGVNYVSSTLVGYTSSTSHIKLPDLNIIKQFNEQLPIPFFAEGGYSSEEDIKMALEYNAYGIVIGTAITRPHIITKGYAGLFNQYYNHG